MSESQSPLNSATCYPDTCAICGRSLAHRSEFDDELACSTIYRRHRRQHFGWNDSGEYDPEDDPYLSENAGADDDGLPEDCQLDTQTYTVERTYEVVEHVTVEAASIGEAKQLAKEEATYNGDYLDTLWSDARSHGEPSQASIDYLELFGLLPEDYEEEAANTGEAGQ